MDPRFYITEETPPFLLLHGTKDTQVPVFHSDILYEKLEKENRLLTAVDGDGNKICTGISLDDSYLSSKLPLSDESSLSVCTDKNHPDVIQDFITYCIWGK